MPDTNRCAECGTPLPAYWPKGLCAQCALDGALDMTNAASQILQPETPITPASLQALSLSTDNSPLGSFGDYDLLEEIARGGMGVVYKARQRKLGRIVAVKMIQAGPLAGKEFVQRFRTESAAAAILQHPNIVAIHDVGVHEGRHYFSMDCVEGQNLTQRVGQQPLPPAKAARYVERIAEAIHYAHERGILHRDLKPSNVLIDTATDQPRVTDFGLAKRFGVPSRSSRDGSGPAEAGTPSWDITVTGQMLGSPNFMPPEQAGAKRGQVGRPSDVYALGGILYYLLTARAPFQADTLEHIITQVLNAEPVSPRLLNPSIPRDLETITLKCLEKEPLRRYQTAKELSDELGRVLRHEPIHARPVDASEKVWRWCRRKPALASAIGFAVGTLLIGLATTSWQWRRAEGQRVAGQHLLYMANMNLAQAAWEQNHVSRVRNLLDETANSFERGFEWYYWQRQMHLEMKALRGHIAPILSVAYSPDGQRIVTGSADHTAKLWNSDAGNELLRLEGHTAPVSSVAFSTNVSRIISGSWDKTAKVWDAVSGRPLVTLEGHEGAIFSVAFSPDGLRAVTGSQDKTARVWDANSGKELLQFPGHSDHILAVAFSSDGQRIVSGSWDKTAKVWDATTGKELRTLIGHSGAVFSAVFSPTEQRILTGSQDSRVKVWDAVSGTNLFTLKGHSAAVFSVGYSLDGTRIITSGEDQMARVWNAATGEATHVLKGHGSRIGSAAFSPNSQRIVTGGGAVQFDPSGRFFGGIGEDQTAKVWKTADIGEGSTLEGHEAAVSSVEFSPNGRMLASGSFDGTARLWDLGTRREVMRLVGHGAAIRSIALFRDGRRLVTGSFDRTAKVWEIATGKELLTLAGHIAEVFSVAVSPDGRWIATGSWDRTVKLWDASTGTNFNTLLNDGGFVYSVAFSTDGERIVSASASRDDGPGRITAWAVSSGKELLAFQNSGKKIWSAAFSDDGRRILTGTYGLTANVWDAATGKEQLTLEGHSAHIHAAVYSPDGRRIVTGSADQTAKLWDAVTGKELLTFRGHAGWILSVAFSPDGQRIATGSRDHTVKVWEAASKEQVARWQQEEQRAAAVEATPAQSR